MNLAKISIRNKGESKAFIETLVRGAKHNSRQLSYDDWNQISYALKNADKNVVLELEAHVNTPINLKPNYRWSVE